MSLRRRIARLRGRPGPVPPVGAVAWGDLRRRSPFSRTWGFDRGTPIDRFYIEQMLDRHRTDITGRVLEVAPALYTARFGTDVTRADVLHVDGTDREATIVADLRDAPSLDDGAFDCVLLTQTLPFIRETERAISTVHRILAPGGVALVTVPGITPGSPFDDERWGDWWRFTPRSIGALFRDRFGAERVQVEGFGSLVSATAFLFGISAEELSGEELAHRDDTYDVTIAVRAVKAGPRRDDPR